jgi:hypothetical protein
LLTLRILFEFCGKKPLETAPIWYNFEFVPDIGMEGGMKLSKVGDLRINNEELIKYRNT